ncbi:MAG: ATP-grasp domain-containing protein [Pseudonocardiaceae bacterium]
MTKLLLVMRNTYGWNGEHIEALHRLGIEVHLATQVAAARLDGRFASVVPISPEADLDTNVSYLVAQARRLGIGTALTFYESDIVLTSLVNRELGHTWANPEAEEISRDKRLQRELLRKHGLPSPRSTPITRADPVAEGLAAMARFRYPVIVKPTYLSASIGVTLASGDFELTAALTEIASLAKSWEGYFLAGHERPIALIEEYLPGKEVTVDGVVLFGKFHLAGVINKMQMGGPYFEEDYYTLPFRTPEEEPELVEITQGIVDALGVDHCGFNAEFRRGTDGRYRVIEFSTRLSGGQNYLCLREVYSLDPIRLFIKATLAGTDPALEEQVWAGELRRSEPKMATCIKYAYRTGTIMRNRAGDVAASPYFRSYLTAAKPGATLRKPPEGWYEFAGSLAIATPYRGPADIDRIERIAADLDTKLDIIAV